MANMAERKGFEPLIRFGGKGAIVRVLGALMRRAMEGSNGLYLRNTMIRCSA